MSALMISTINVKNQEKLQDYLQKIRAIGAKYGAEMVFNGMANGAVRGSVDHQIAVIVRFPTLEAIDAMYADAAYQPLIPLRDEASDMTIIKYTAKA